MKRLIFAFILCLNFYLANSVSLDRLNKVEHKIYLLSGQHYDSIALDICNIVNPEHEDDIISIIFKESEFNERATSKKYWGEYRDYGLMQISSYYFKFNKVKIYESYYNISIGYAYYLECLDDSKGSSYYAFQRYNGSIEYADEVIQIKYKLLERIFYDRIYS